MKVGTQLRHGDVLLIRVGNLPEGKQVRRREPIVEYGEMTGHAHRLTGDAEVILMDGREEQKYVIVGEQGGTLIHEEHDTIILDPGYYQAVRQKEFNQYERSARNVLD
jgi:hypothetical protein